MPNINKIIQNNLSILHADEDIKKLPRNSLTIIYRRERNLEEILSASLFPPKFNKNESYISNCNKCDICKNFLISGNKFKSTVTGRVYRGRGRVCSVRGSLSCKALMLFTLFLVIFVETSMQVQLLILIPDLEYTKVSSRQRKTGVVLPHILTKNVAIVAIDSTAKRICAK